jgi:hypothetical protein
MNYLNFNIKVRLSLLIIPVKAFSDSLGRQLGVWGSSIYSPLSFFISQLLRASVCSGNVQ